MKILNRSTILVVDDNPTNIKVLFSFLKEAGFKVLVAQDGQSALEKLVQITPDLILLDVMMPGIDGFDVCQRLQENSLTQDIPIILMTALNDPVDKVKGLSLGAVDYITKPFNHEELLARVKLHLKLRHLTLSLAEKNQELNQLNQILEQKVEERTVKLKEAQSQLVITEKMSALGQLVAGVAHEINNPVNFIYGNISCATQYTNNLLELVQMYQAALPETPANIKAKIAETDLDFIMDDLPKILDSMQLGAGRIQEIVMSLKTFARHDQAGYKMVDIHHGIDSTLMILQSRMKPNGRFPGINVIKNYDKMPLVQCYAGQLNQVFMNLLVNAIDALEETDKMERLINITTAYKINEFQVSIADNGPGIPRDIQHRLFDPFFTTKDVGKGTGLGLSIAYSIVVEKHKGQLHCYSELGQGTKFVVAIPCPLQYSI